MVARMNLDFRQYGLDSILGRSVSISVSSISILISTWRFRFDGGRSQFQAGRFRFSTGRKSKKYARAKALKPAATQDLEPRSKP